MQTHEFQDVGAYQGKITRGAYQRAVCALPINAYVPWALLDIFYQNKKGPFRLDPRHFLKFGVTEEQVRHTLELLESHNLLTIDAEGAIHLNVL